MSEQLNRLEIDDLKENLRDVQAILIERESVLEQREDDDHARSPADAPAEDPDRFLPELRERLHRLHPADVAFILEALPPAQRLVAWDLVDAESEGEILLEVSDAVRETLIESMDSDELVAATETLDADEIADLAPDLPQEVIEEVVEALPAEERARLRAAMSYEEGRVGALMDFDMVSVRDDVTLETVTRYLRRMDRLPRHTDQLFVVDREKKLLGRLPLARLIVSDLELSVSAVMVPEEMKFYPEDSAEDAAGAFERYDLVSAPVVDAFERLIGRLTVDDVMDYIREKSAETQRAEAGLAEEEDVFAPVWNSFRNRWSWLALNLVTAFIASRVIGAFEGSIERLTALAALMPIVAGIGGNSGNQTITMIVRALAMGQIQPGYWRKLFAKEIGLAMLNGAVWGVLLGFVAWLLYRSVPLAGVMAMAMMLNFMLAAGMGVTIPWLRARFGRDPAVGSSVLITACTDSGGFFIFLGLATLFLL